MTARRGGKSDAPTIRNRFVVDIRKKFVDGFVGAGNKVMNLDRFELA